MKAGRQLGRRKKFVAGSLEKAKESQGTSAFDDRYRH